MRQVLMRRVLSPLAAVLVAQTAWAAEPSGCDKFAWPLEKEQRLLGEPQAVSSGADLDRAAGRAVTIKLTPLEGAELPSAPERKPQRTPALVGYLRFGKAAAAGLYKVSLSEAPGSMSCRTRTT
ncbi:MAG: hypothetical protein ACHQAY_01325 [Hyphomicrobiales bacterium]